MACHKRHPKYFKMPEKIKNKEKKQKKSLSVSISRLLVGRCFCGWYLSGYFSTRRYPPLECTPWVNDASQLTSQHCASQYCAAVQPWLQQARTSYWCAHVFVLNCTRLRTREHSSREKVVGCTWLDVDIHTVWTCWHANPYFAKLTKMPSMTTNRQINSKLISGTQILFICFKFTINITYCIIYKHDYCSNIFNLATTFNLAEINA